MTQFCNPYHFVPVGKSTEKSIKEHHLKVADSFDQEEKSQGERHQALENYSHAQYYPNTFSGRIICKLTTKDALFIGADQERPDPNDIATAHPFELDGKPAIPASSLRGLLSSLAETASNSALRVLDDRVLSYRQDVQDALSAIGMVVCKEENGQVFYRLKPLTLPTLEKIKETDSYSYKPSEEQNYGQLFRSKVAPLRVHLCYDNPFLVGKETFNFAAPEFYYAKLHRHRFVQEHGKFVIKKDDTLHYSKGGVVVGQQREEFILTSKEWKTLPPTQKGLYTRGILRILGIEGRRDMVDTKKYDLFIPYPEEKENLAWEKLQPILPEAIERFEQLADERTEATEKEEQTLDILPYHPLGTSRNLSNDPKEQKKLRLKDGDLVYFRPALDSNGKDVVITEVSFSAVWRARVETNDKKSASVHEFFKEISPELLPFNKSRNYVSPAELLFGFVQKDKEKDSGAGRALAGRVNVSFGRLAPHHSEPYYQEEVPLKSLLFPKPPCPIMYFKGQHTEEGITKSTLKLKQHLPQGRKMYLHSYPQDSRKQPWKTVNSNENQQLKTKIQPLKPDTVFYFHLDFNNLNRWELGLLFYALRPCADFYHKLGMGKPLGMGKAQIDPVGLFLIDRNQRYRTDDVFESPRYHQTWVNDKLPSEFYPRECQTAQQPLTPAPSWEQLRDEFANTMSPTIRNALELLGDPTRVPTAVHVPKEGNVGLDQTEIENENFKWFENNYGKQQLKPLDEHSTSIPALEREN
jgi:CRISPR-associated protein (TIGR03986 family)